MIRRPAPRSIVLRAIALSAIALAVGCSEDPEPTSPPGEPPSGESPASVPGSTATLEGVVRIAEGVELPQYPDNPMVPAPGRPELPEACTPAQQRDRQPVQRSASGALAGMLVALHDFTTVPEHEPVTHTMAIRDCRLTPRLLVATRGDLLHLTNETDYPFLPDLGQGLMQALLHEQTRELELAQGGVRSLTCGFAAPCGRAEVVTLYHPLHAVTGEDGTFRIEGVPAGEALRVSAWHPLFEESSERLTLRAGETRRVELVVRAAPAPTPPPPTEPGASPDPGGDVLF